MTVYIPVAVLVVLALAYGVYGYLHGGPDGGRDPGMSRNEYARQRLERRLAKNRTFEKAEERFQREQAERNPPPTHES